MRVLHVGGLRCSGSLKNGRPAVATAPVVGAGEGKEIQGRWGEDPPGKGETTAAVATSDRAFLQEARAASNKEGSGARTLGNTAGALDAADKLKSAPY